MKCNLCPRNCFVDREVNKGFCGVDSELLVSRAALHYWEEPCISGESGSGAVFFSGCQLKCVYCQNKDISNGKVGKKITVERLAQIFMELQEKGANNINLVTPDHFANSIISALKIAKTKGLNLPVVYNCSGYSSVETLQKFEGYVDIYMPDFKYMDNALAKKYSNAEDYPEIAKVAIAEMFRQVGKPVYFDNGLMKKGMIVRHLVLPSYIKNSKSVLKYLYETYKDDVVLSIMSQFTPICLDKYPEINRKITAKEYDEVIDFAVSIGIENAYTQDGEAAEESFIPNFLNYEGV